MSYRPYRPVMYNLIMELRLTVEYKIWHFLMKDFFLCWTIFNRRLLPRETLVDRPGINLRNIFQLILTKLPYISIFGTN